MTPGELQAAVERLSAALEPPLDRVIEVVSALLESLEKGEVRAATPSGEGWRIHPWVKQGILLAFRRLPDASTHVDPVFHFRDRRLLETQDPTATSREVRVVPGGTTVRRGACIRDRVVLMPPAYVNIGAYVDAETMVDSHALVGSCAQVGRRVHISAAAQIGGVLEPVGARPVIIEDDVFVGGGCGIYEGTRVGRGAVLAAGVVLTASVPLFDLVHQREVRADPGGALDVPPGAVVVPGSRPVRDEWGRRRGLSLAAPIIVRYRDPGSPPPARLEEALR